MKENFCTYEQALALKELGYNEPCFGTYIGKEKELKNYVSFLSIGGNDSINAITISYSELTKQAQEDFILAPLKSQVFKWFRKNSSINGIVSYYGKDQWNIEILDYKGNELIQIEDNTFWSYEEAESACIDKLIELIKDLSK